ncbi:helix-turn-helix domain-containing protein [Pseudomonas koreensis]|jgi:transcriptional regulator with XRE-family HTH domain|uniref:helix-turn-helix domain-containing protein n=1 Tax=Pseudomonas koreensis TaxID=198620 RepID=UPI0018E6AAF8|nr:helix-turn-helix transcriptional regulator [Pseudomonas koreensis]MBI6949767.1 helix-turn-helix transcriptional regulator [Pseudomonas koreensis]
MERGKAFGVALKRYRIRAGLSQEAFSTVSSRTYISTLERGLKNPTLDKINEIASALSVHPLTLLTTYYLGLDDTQSIDDLFALVRSELIAVNGNTSDD